MTQPIFIFSLPRSGSTLLQRLLMTNPQVASLGEPSLLLRLLGNDELSARRSVYWEFLVDMAVDDMRSHWNGYDECYRNGVRRMMLDIYQGLAGGKPFFIDKTPRYTLIAEEIRKTFPEAKCIVLWRHPLAVAASMSAGSGKSRWFPEDHAVDLQQGLLRLDAFTRKHKDDICVVRYGDLVTEPARELERIGSYLGWPDLPKALEEPLPEDNGGSLGDTTGVKKFKTISAESLHAWEKSYHNFYRRNWAKRYCSGERLEVMKSHGYALPESITNGSGGIISGILDATHAMLRRRRRITHPRWVARQHQDYLRDFGFDVSWR